MGVISILLGFIAFFAFTGAGAIIANAVVDYKASLSLMLTSLSTVPNGGIFAVIVGFFAFIGLLTGVNLIMHGLTYNKVAKIQTQLRRRG